MDFKQIKEIAKDKNVQWVIVIILAILVLYLSSSIRLSNWDLLTDATTGEKSPATELDTFYFMRMSEIILDNGGLPESDALRFAPNMNFGWTLEVMPYLNVWIYKFVSVFADVTLKGVIVASPVIYYIFGMIIFLFLIYFITRNKWISLLAFIFLSFNMGYLQRTIAGFADHDSIGTMALYLVFLFFVLFLTYILYKKENSWYKYLLAGALIGLLTAFNIASWGGVAKFLFMIIPPTFFFIWIFNVNEFKIKENVKLILFYFMWIIFTFLFGFLFGFSFNAILGFFTSASGILSSIIFVFMIVDLFLIWKNFSFVKSKFRILYSFLFTFIMGIIGLFLIGKNPFVMAVNIIKGLISPWGTGRIGLTVAENAQPYLTDWMGSVGSIIFWMFIFGIFIFGFKLIKNIKHLKSKIIFFALYCLTISGILFSRISSASMLNGDNFLSYMAYFVPLLLLAFYFFKLYFRNEIKFDIIDCFIVSWIFFTIISGRAAARMLFSITPFVCFFAAYFIDRIFHEWKNSKEELLKIILILAIVISLILSGMVIKSSYESISASAKYFPTISQQWQETMSWVRNNTPTNSIFTHWWDYGYLVQTVGERKTTADGGHFENAYDGDIKIGRYVLTTPYPETALSFFKSMQVTHLLIDPSDLGKYSAYSKIGSDDNWDRFSILPIGTYDPTQVQEKANETAYVYQIQGIVDEDIIYNKENVKIFLPGPIYDKIGIPSYKSYLIAIGFKIQNENYIQQPNGIFYYNGNQYTIPLRYVYMNGNLLDFKTGLDAVAMFIPSLAMQDQGISMDNKGAVIYLSPKVSKSLFAQLYLLNDAFGNYPTLKLVHSEDDPVIKYLKAQGANVKDFVYYQGFRGPMKIWDTTSIPSNINVVSEFYAPPTGKYADLDGLKFAN